MAQFKPAFDFLMQHEDPGLTGKVTEDSGGVTRWGISQRAYPGLDVRNLPLTIAQGIYQRDYFTPIHGPQIDQQQIASKLLDMAVNMGVKTAIMLLQVALNVHCQPRNDLLTEDGKMGPHTVAAVNRADPSLALVGLVECSKQHYQHIAQVKPTEAEDLKGWLNRAAKLPPVYTSAVNA